MSRLQLEDVLEHRTWSRHIPQREIKIECLAVHFPRYLRMLQKRFDLGRKNKEIFAGVVIDRLYTETIPDQQKPLPALIPDGKSKHSAEIAHAVVAIFFVCMNDRFRVRSSHELMTTGYQIRSEIRVVIDFSVKHYRNGPIFIEDGLLSSAEVD